MKKKIINISKIITFEDNSDKLKIIDSPEVLIQNDKIIQINDIVEDCDEIINAEKCVLTPGFIDSHSHPVFVGDRSNEFQMRLKGMSYNEITDMGGGIISSIKMLRNSSDDELYESTFNNIKPFIFNGTTTLEAKSGYGLTTEDEIRSLEILNKINDVLDIDIIPTFLGAHAVPPEYSNTDYVNIICDEMIPEISRRNLAVFCDVFCEEGYFNIEDSEKILNVAKSYGLIPRIHAEEFKYSGGVELAKKINAASADHLMAINDKGISALADSNVVATLLPGTTFMLNKNKYANGRKLIDSKCSVALATDFNPGTCTIRSLTKIMLLAILKCGMSIEESFKGITINGARAVQKNNILGSIKKGYKADILFWNIDKIDEIVYWEDSNKEKLKKIMKNGKIIN